MKASVYTQYGPLEVLQLVDVPKPTPRDHEVLVKVRATIGDTIIRSFKLPNITGWQKFMARLILGWNTPRRHPWHGISHQKQGEKKGPIEVKSLLGCWKSSFNSQ